MNKYARTAAPTTYFKHRKENPGKLFSMSFLGIDNNQGFSFFLKFVWISEKCSIKKGQLLRRLLFLLPKGGIRNIMGKRKGRSI